MVCQECESGYSLQLRKRGPRETWPAFISCLACGHGNDHPLITNGLVDAAIAARVGRTRREDSDTFSGEWRGHTLEGECVPEFHMDDVVTVVTQLSKLGKRELRARKAKVKWEARGWWRGQKQIAGQVTGTAKAAALSAAWTMQTGGAGPTRSTKRRRRCTVKGCRGGMVTIRTRVHSTTGKTQKVKVPCGVCHRAEA
ncbi:hypothetical protein ABT124_37085 [Streptomyces sp. NPDC001982]|uniref:hypothetical protein n=1 Tax=Streptomyces sp. NPDC001982 TaxID=3154405 RepID=UPI00331A61B2